MLRKILTFLKKKSKFPGNVWSPPETRAIVKDPGNERFRMRSDSRKKNHRKIFKNKKVRAFSLRGCGSNNSPPYYPKSRDIDVDLALGGELLMPFPPLAYASCQHLLKERRTSQSLYRITVQSLYPMVSGTFHRNPSSPDTSC